MVGRLKAYVYDVIGCCQRVHQELGPFLNEYMYQDALKIDFTEQHIPFEKEYSFFISYHNQPIAHPHRADFLVKGHILLECKAVEELHAEHRQQLWNYMRLAKIKIGILYNFAPIKDQCEKYYLDTTSRRIVAF